MKYVVISILAVALLAPLSAEATPISGWKSQSYSYSWDSKKSYISNSWKKDLGKKLKKALKKKSVKKKLVLKKIIRKKYMKRKKVPEPATLGLVALGLVGLGMSRRRVARG